MDSLISAIIGHLVGDYLLQNDYLAQGKKRSHWICLIHALIWSTSVMIFAGWTTWSLTLNQVIIAHLALLITHFIQDRWGFIIWWMRLMGQREFMRADELVVKRSMMPGAHDWTYEAKIRVGLGPWSIIVVDNVWHIVQIWAVAKFIIG